MRLYTFCNMYLSSIQQGIQTAHIVSELWVKYGAADTSPELTHLYGWAKHHKTIIVLNAGYSSEIYSLAEDFFRMRENPYPWAFFHEDPMAIGSMEENTSGALTAVGIVIPEKIYELYAAMRKGDPLMWSNLRDRGFPAEDFSSW